MRSRVLWVTKTTCGDDYILLEEASKLPFQQSMTILTYATYLSLGAIYNYIPEEVTL